MNIVSWTSVLHLGKPCKKYPERLFQGCQTELSNVPTTALARLKQESEHLSNLGEAFLRDSVIKCKPSGHSSKSKP